MNYSKNQAKQFPAALALTKSRKTVLGACFVAICDVTMTHAISAGSVRGCGACEEFEGAEPEWLDFIRRPACVIEYRFDKEPVI